MDGRMNQRRGAWVGRWIGLWISGRLAEWRDVCEGWLLSGWMDGRTDG